METIMAVDDNLTNLTILKTILEQDYKVIPLPSGEKALEVLKKNIIVPDLILLDIDMPGITGFDVVRELKKDIVLQQIPVILLSAYNDGKMIHEGIELGVDDYVTKPFSDFTEDADCVVECIDAATLAKIIQIIVLTASKVKSQSSAVRANSTARAQIKKGAKQPPAPKQSAHAVVKQQVKATLDEVDDWEW